MCEHDEHERDHDCCCEERHGHGHGHGCCCKEHGSHGHRSGCGESHGRHFHRRFATRAERIAGLEEYLEDLRAEVKAVEEHIAEMKAAG